MPISSGQKHKDYQIKTQIMVKRKATHPTHILKIFAILSNNSMSSKLAYSFFLAENIWSLLTLLVL